MKMSNKDEIYECGYEDAVDNIPQAALEILNNINDKYDSLEYFNIVDVENTGSMSMEEFISFLQFKTLN